jgi:hypothetical protein
MSLDVYLTVDAPQARECGSGIFIRRDGATVEISREEWDRLHPDREPATVVSDETESTEVYSANITHNLNKMAEAAGIYEPLWRPDEIGIAKAAQLIGPLREGLTRLTGDPASFTPLNPENGWGTYGELVSFVEKYLRACIEHPDAAVSVSR